MRDMLQRIGLRSWVKLSGGKGVHVTVPLERLDWQQFSDFSRILASRLVSDQPATFVDKASKDARKKRIFIDWLRNARGATAVAPWSVRARDNAPVATPLLWEELGVVDGADVMTVRVLMEYLASNPDDPWAGLRTTRQRVTAQMLALLGGDPS